MPQSIISQFSRAYNSPIEVNRQVATATERDAINSSVRWEGMLVYVVADGVTYELSGGISNGNWQELGGLQDAPSDGETYGRRDGNWEIIDSGLTQELGDFTPTLEDVGGGATYAIGSVQFANYVKIGSLVHFTIYLINITTTGTPSGQFRLNGLPYPVVDDTEMASVGISGGDVSYYSMRALVDNVDPSSVVFVIKNALNASVGPSYSSVTLSSGQIRLSGTYITP